MSNVVYALAYFLPVCAILWLFATVIAFCANDARRRGKSPLLVALACFFFFPVGLIAWLLFRPDPMDKGGPRPFRLEDYRVQ